MIDLQKDPEVWVALTKYADGIHDIEARLDRAEKTQPSSNANAWMRKRPKTPNSTRLLRNAALN